MNEWRDVPGYEGLYQINIDTPQGKCRRFCKTGKVRELSNKPNKRYGRLFWGLCKDGKLIKQQAARWIALTYPELVQNEYFPGAEIDHIDTDRMNNHPSNLRWATRKENNNNPLTLKHFSKAKKGKKRTEETRKKISETLTGKQLNRPDQSKSVIQFSLNKEVLHFYPSVMQAERETGVDNRHISECCLGKHKSAGGFIWKYTKDFHPLVLRLLKNTYLVNNLLSRNAS